jgi:hypothetical protein
MKMSASDKLHDPLRARLLPGAHEWPSRYGSGFIAEAAMVAAGFEYKVVRSAADCPPCFSPVVAAYLIYLNDGLADALQSEGLSKLERQKFAPFVLRLSGSADSAEVERQRLEYITTETVRRIVSSAIRAEKLFDWEARCRAVANFDEAIRLAAKVAETGPGEWSAHAAEGAAGVGEAWGEGPGADACADAVAWAAKALEVTGEYWAPERSAASRAGLIDEAVSIVEGALAIGKQAPEIDLAVALERIEQVKANKEHS